jgi:hypothetical protein
VDEVQPTLNDGHDLDARRDREGMDPVAPRARHRRVLRLLVLCLGILVGLGALGTMRLVDASCSPFAGRPCVRVLFLGNSYTYVNDLPTVFRNIARAGGQNVATGMVAAGGETLADHAASAASAGAIRDSRWQFVVLQEQSEVPAIESARQAQMYPAVRSLAGEIRAANATPFLLQTWAHRDGLPADGMGYVEMQSAIDTGYAAIGDQLGVAVAPAGQAWETVLRQDPTIALWQADGSHPSAAGTYLAACVLYARIFGASPVGIPDTEGLPVDLARALQVVAGQP